MKIPVEEIEFHPTSFCDRNGRLFSWRGELYRAMSPRGAKLSRKLFQDGVVQQLVKKGLLVETEPTDLSLDGYDLVLKHRRLPFVSFPYEWSAEMMKDAALSIIDLEIELARHNLALDTNDANPLNLLFEGCRPIYIDFGSINRAGQVRSNGYDCLRTYCVFPLKMTAKGEGNLARLLLQEDGPLLQRFAAASKDSTMFSLLLAQLRRAQSFAGAALPTRLRPLVAQTIGFLRSRSVDSSSLTVSSRVNQMRRLRAEIESFEIPVRASAEVGLAGSAVWTRKGGVVQESLSALRPATALVIGSNGDGCPELAARFVRDVAVIAPDDAVVDQQYRVAKRHNLAILPLVIDIRHPSPGLGVRNREYAPATERLACELVCALDVVHRLVFQRYLTFDQIAGMLSDFATRWLIVEFVSPNSAEARRWGTDEFFSWYSLQNFIESLRRHFSSVKIHQTERDERFLLLCAK
jgi:hypothetical protein